MAEQLVDEGTADEGTVGAVTEPIEEPRPFDVTGADVPGADVLGADVPGADVLTAGAPTVETGEAGAEVVDVVDVTGDRLAGPGASDGSDSTVTGAPDGWTGLMDAPMPPEAGLHATVSMAGAGTDGATGPDLQAVTWATTPWEATAGTGVGGAPAPPDAAPGWDVGTGAEVSPRDQSDGEGFGEEIDPSLPSPAGSVASVAEPLSIHSLLFGTGVPSSVDDVDDGYGGGDGYGVDDGYGGGDGYGVDDGYGGGDGYGVGDGTDLDASAPAEIASGGWTPSPVAPEAPLATDQAAFGVPGTAAGEAPAAPPFVLVPPEPLSQVPPYAAASVPSVAGAEPVDPEPVTSVPPVDPEPVTSVPPVVAGSFTQADADVLAQPVPVAPGVPDPAPAEVVPLMPEAAVQSQVPTGPDPEPDAGPAVAPLAGTGTPKPEATSARAKKNADLFKGGPEFPDIFKLAMEGTSIGSNVSVRYDAASPRAKEAASSTPKSSIPAPDDKAGKRRRRRSSH